MAEQAEIAGRLLALRERIAAAARKAGRRAEDITLVAVSKRQPLERVAAALAAGQRLFGENQVQEAAGKIPLLRPEAEWHLIGPLQSNKVKVAAGLFTAVHSVDREKIARLLSAAASEQGRRVQAFLQIHLGDEASKHGFDPKALEAEVRGLHDLPGLEWVGLMAIPPFFDDAEAVRPYFRELRRLRDQVASWPGWSGFRGWLSMGMSHDFEVAIAEGATHVRVGTAIFGERQAR